MRNVFAVRRIQDKKGDRLEFEGEIDLHAVLLLTQMPLAIYSAKAFEPRPNSVLGDLSNVCQISLKGVTFFDSSGAHLLGYFRELGIPVVEIPQVVRDILAKCSMSI